MKRPDLKLPEWLKGDLKMPSFGGRRPTTPKTKMKAPSVKAPKFVSDLYADLRDRRLLPLVALLLVALVAAPILLSGKGDDEEAVPPPAAMATQDESPAAASFAVVPADVALRAYRQRLGHRQARNPFAQPAAKSSGEGGEVESGGGESSTGGGSSSGGEFESSGGESSSGGSSTTVTKTTTDIIVQSTVTGYALTVRSGFLGDIKKHDGITAMTTLPSAKNEVLVFVGLSKDKKGAIFLMTSNVTAFYGKAKCVLDEQVCSTVELRPGQSATFAVGYGDTRYKLTLKKIHPLVETSEDAASVTEKSGGSGGEETAR